jgi:Polysaccharide deacetylase
MIGLEVDAHPGMAREVAAAGHMIANHTWSHVDVAVLPPVAAADQINRATDAIHTVTGRVPTLFRAPYGAWSPVVLQRCAQAGMTPLDWSVDPRDWSRPGVASIIDNIMRNTKTGSIILEHDGGGNRSQTVAALKIVLPPPPGRRLPLHHPLAHPTALGGRGIDGGPVGGHVDHGPLVLGGGGEDLVSAAAQDRIAVVGVLPVAVGVVDDQFQGPAWAGRGPLEHGQVAVGVPGGHDRALPDVPVDRAGLLRAVVDDLDGGALDEFGAAVADAEVAG